MCLLCNEILANESFKMNKLKRHIESNHVEFLGKSTDFFNRKQNEFMQQQNTFKSHLKVNEKYLLASYEASYLIAKAKKPFTIGEELILPAAIKICEIIHGKEISDVFKYVPLSNDTVTSRIREISNDQLQQLIYRIKQSPNFAIQIDETTDITNMAQVSTYARYCFEDHLVEEFMFCCPLKTRTTGEDIFKILNDFFDKHLLLWKNCAGVCSDGAAAMTGKLNGLFAKIKLLPHTSNIKFTHCMIHREALVAKKISPELDKVLKEVVTVINFIKSRALNSRLFSQLCNNMGSNYENLLSHAEVRWLSRGRTLQRVLQLKDEIRIFLIQKNHDMANYFCDESWMLKLCYMADVFDKLNELNLSLQGENVNILNLYGKINGFVKKIQIWKLAIDKNNIDMFQYTKEFIDENELSLSIIKDIIVGHLSALETQFKQYFCNEFNISNYEWILQPFNINCETLQHLEIKAQKEFAEMSTDSTLKLTFSKQTVDNFWLSIKNEYPLLSSKAIDVILPFATTYLCESAFSTLLYLKSKYRNRIRNIDEIMRPALCKIEPRFSLLCSNKQAHPSH
jgi:hypothetical protein